MAALLSDRCDMLRSVERISVSPLFIGRGTELATLSKALRRAAEGQPQALLVGGEAGVGKTRLLEEFQCAAADTATVVVGGCLEVGAEGLPYAPFATMLRRLHRELGSELEAAAEGHESSLARLLPDFGEAAPESHDEFARARLFEHTALLFERLAAERTLVLAVEDLHWSDRSTRELLAYLIRTLQQARVVIIGTYRSDDLHRRHPVRPYLAELERLRTVQRLELRRLVQREVGQQLAGILRPSVPDRDLVQRIYARSEGNPFFVEELAVSYQRCPRGLTESLRDLLLVRVEALPEDTQGILRVLAVGGSTVEHGLLAAATGLPEDQLADSLRTAVDANIIRPSNDEDGYQFRHALVREAVSDDLMPGERTRINRRYATALAATPALVCRDQATARLADYWYHAHDAALALPAALDAGREARRRNAFAEQLRMLERAIELWDDVPEQVLGAVRAYDWAEESYPACGCEPGQWEESCERLRLIDVLAEATVAARLSGEHDRGMRFVKRALRIVDEASEPDRAAWFLMQRGLAKRYSNSASVVDDHEQALRLLAGRGPSAVLAEVLNRRACDGMLGETSREHLDSARQALAIAREVGARSTELHARLTLGMLHAAFGEYQEAADALDGIVEQAAEICDVDLQCRVHINLSSYHQQLGRAGAAVAAARQGLALVRRNGMAAYNGTIVLGNLAEPLLYLGELDEAGRLLEEELFGTGQDVHQDFLRRLRGDLALLRGDLTAAAGQLASSGCSRTAWQPQKFLPTSSLAIRIASRTGRFAEARQTLLAVLDRGATPGHERETWQLLTYAAAAEADAYGLPAMEQDRARTLERIRTAAAGLSQGLPLFAAWARMLDAELARAERRDTPADWLAVAEALRVSEQPHPRALALLRAAQALAVAGEREAASAAAASAAELAERQGDVHLVETVRQLIDRARLRPAEGAAAPAAAAQVGDGAGEEGAPAFGLTKREQDVLRLVALGWTNRQIAVELYISPKTASVHVSNILGKLAVAGRGEAAAMAHRLHLIPAA
jgi:DNA-binding NarL/FixJ family response regulator